MKRGVQCVASLTDTVVAGILLPCPLPTAEEANDI
jgi:hypothetical protein